VTFAKKQAGAKEETGGYVRREWEQVAESPKWFTPEFFLGNHNGTERF